jgi:2,3-dihydroxybenzoate-AMP ligase
VRFAGPRGPAKRTLALRRRVSAEEIENLILGHPGRPELACIPVPDPVLGERMCACVVPRAGAPALSLDQLVAFLRSHEIAAFKLPERLEVLDAFPLSPVGKVSKKDLVARYSTAGTRG